MPKSKKKKFYTRFWRITYEDLQGLEKSRLSQGPKHYTVARVKKILKAVSPEIKIISIKRVPRPEWSVIFEIIDEAC